MITQTPWVERKFNFDFPTGLLPIIIGRLKGAPVRSSSLVREHSKEKLTRPPAEGWSAQQHSWHLIEIEHLHLARLEDYRAGKKELREADMTNRRTEEADYNSADIGEIVGSFSRERAKFVAQLERMDEKEVTQNATHPRLLVEMRLVDMAYFVAEHDDHHLALISTLLSK